MNETISLQELFSVLKKSLWQIVALTIVAALISFAVSTFLIKPTYQADTQILVTPKKQENDVIDASQVQSSVTLVNTYRVIIKSPAILEKVQAEVGNAPDSISALNDMVTVESEQNSQVINVSVQSTDAALASNVANSVAKIFSEDIPDLMNVDNVKVLSVSGIPTSPVSPNILLNTAIAGIVGLLLGVGLAFLREVLDRRIRTEDQVQQILDLPVLGSIPDIESKVFKATTKAKANKREAVKQYG
ncbi:YveK family protein [Exiguobacterium artemiae]